MYASSNRYATRRTTGAPAWHSHPATQAQKDSILKNIGRKQLTDTVRDGILADLADPALTKGKASLMMDVIFDAAWKPRETTPEQAQVAQAKAQLTTGYYLAPNNTVIKVVQNKTNVRLSGRRLVGTSWVYQDGRDGVDLLAEAAAGHMVTVEEAAKFGHDTHTCLICGAKLDEQQLGEHASKGVQLSVARGIGPTCWKNLKLQDPAFAARQSA